MILQLNPCIPVKTPKGKALAHALIDSGIEHDLLWVCFQDTTGECWTWKNTQIRAQTNVTHGREYISPFYDPKDVAFPDEDLCPDCRDDSCGYFGTSTREMDLEEEVGMLHRLNNQNKEFLKVKDSKIKDLEDLIMKLIKKNRTCKSTSEECSDCTSIPMPF